MEKGNLLFWIVFSLVLSSCSRYGYVHLDYPQAPAAYFPEGVDDLAVVNRSLTKADDQQTKVIESIMTGEVAGSDKLASDEAIKGVYDGIHTTEGIHIVIPRNLRLYGTGTRETPAVMEWERVAAICDSTGADALLVLETFDSNSDLLLQTAAGQVGSILATGKPSVRIPRQARVDVRCYWRLYDPHTKTIADQFQQSHYLRFNLLGGIAPFQALSETAYAAGHEYVQRFLPSFYSVRRELYKKGKGQDKHQFNTGWRRSEVANWEGAIEAWAPLADNPGSQLAGQAALNTAVAHEVLGDTDQALEWAQRAYEDYGDKLARDYAKTLLRRKNIER
ncbi:DUF6340 family protein [uncultured Sunxiuqinia sp.]|uniref:DUF6340 family protein n=1 Tax=uncultured Sunxiuqinia sp. TaxID=1573825 RepID=UPI0030D8E86B|tara:strand:+ start:45343 stop:46347 length:1005 start_codon:yes stop_codon:yes gene_type:complete